MKITIYGTTNCAFCKTEKQWLDSKWIEYTYVNLDEDEAARMFLQQTLDISRVPVTMITEGEDTKIVFGFDRPKLMEAIGI